MEENIGSGTEVIRVAEPLRNTLLLSLAYNRAARAELGEAQLRLKVVVDKLDVEGVLIKGFKEVGALVNKFQETELKLNAVLAEVQKASGVDIRGYTVDSETGVLKKS